MSQNTHPHRPLMVQAPVRALDPDGVAVVTAGTVGFALAAAICWWSHPQLVATGREWYLWVSIAGTVIGLFGLAVGLSRKVRRRRAGGDQDAIDAAFEPSTPLQEGEPGPAPRRAAP